MRYIVIGKKISADLNRVGTTSIIKLSKTPIIIYFLATLLNHSLALYPVLQIENNSIALLASF